MRRSVSDPEIALFQCY